LSFADSLIDSEARMEPVIPLRSGDPLAEPRAEPLAEPLPDPPGIDPRVEGRLTEDLREAYEGYF